jgi:hypothetical protein
MGQIPAIRPGRLATSLLLASLILFLSAISSLACPICLSGVKMTMGEKLDLADGAVLAIPLGEPGHFRILQAIKGTFEVGSILIEPSLPAVQSVKPLLMLRNGLAQRWESLGTIGAEYARWLRQVAAADNGAHKGRTRSGPLSPVRSSLTDVEWTERVAIVAPNLESPDPLVAEIAYGEISRAPYGALRSLKRQLDADHVSAWIDDPKLVARRSGYILLLGIAGGLDDAARLEKLLDSAWAARDSVAVRRWARRVRAPGSAPPFCSERGELQY